jgi:hypothetical protein
MRGRHQRPIWPRCGRLMGNIGMETESMEQRPESGFVIPVEQERWRPQQQLRPVRAVQRAVLNGFAQMPRLDTFCRVKIRNRARHF